MEFATRLDRGRTGFASRRRDGSVTAPSTNLLRQEAAVYATSVRIPPRASRVRGADNNTLLRMYDQMKTLVRTTGAEAVRRKADAARQRIVAELARRGARI